LRCAGGFNLRREDLLESRDGDLARRPGAGAGEDVGEGLRPAGSAASVAATAILSTCAELPMSVVEGYDMRLRKIVAAARGSSEATRRGAGRIHQPQARVALGRKGRPFQFLKKLKVHEVSPVLLGAGIGTYTASVKGARPADLAALYRRSVASIARASMVQAGLIERAVEDLKLVRLAKARETIDRLYRAEVRGRL
jgi:hypothetical protein